MDSSKYLEFLKQQVQQKEVKLNKLKDTKLLNSLVLQESFFDNLKVLSKEIFKNKIVVKPYTRKKAKLTSRYNRIVNLLLSDLHFGANLDPREVPLRYGFTEEARRIAAIAYQAAEFKKQYRDKTVLYIHLLGDIIQNTLHDPRDGNPLAEQCAEAIYLLSQCFGFLATSYPRVVIRCATGNHGRNTARHKGRAVDQKWDSIETIIYYALKQALASVPNIEFQIPYTPYFTYRAFNLNGFASHGDTVLNPGQPGKSLNVESIRKQTNEINAKLATDQQFSLFMVGHVHFASSAFLPNGAVFLSNGALIPTDSYGLSLGSLNISCGQWLWESVPNKILGDHRFLMVDEYTDKDSSLDKLIKPFQLL